MRQVKMLGCVYQRASVGTAAAAARGRAVPRLAPARIALRAPPCFRPSRQRFPRARFPACCAVAFAWLRWARTGRKELFLSQLSLQGRVSISKPSRKTKPPFWLLLCHAGVWGAQTRAAQMCLFCPSPVGKSSVPWMLLGATIWGLVGGGRARWSDEWSLKYLTETLQISSTQGDASVKLAWKCRAAQSSWRWPHGGHMAWLGPLGSSQLQAGGTLLPLGWVLCLCQTEGSIHTPEQSKQTAKPSLHKLAAYATAWKMMGVPNQQKIPGTAAELGTKLSYCRSGLYRCSQYHLHSSGFAAGVFCCSLLESSSWRVSQQESCECVREQCFKWGFTAKYLLKTMFT